MTPANPLRRGDGWRHGSGAGLAALEHPLDGTVTEVRYVSRWADVEGFRDQGWTLEGPLIGHHGRHAYLMSRAG